MKHSVVTYTLILTFTLVCPNLYAQLKPELTLSGHNQGITKLQFSKDGRSLFSAGDRNGSLRIWSVSKGVQTNFLPIGDQYIWAAAMSPDARYAAGSSQDNRTVLYNVETNSKIATLNKSYQYLSYTPDSKYLITSAGEVLTAATGKPSSYSLGPIGKFAISKDSKFVISAGPLGVSVQSILDTKNKSTFIKYPPGFVLPPYTGGIALNSTMTRAVIGYYASEGISMIRVVDVPGKKVLNTFETPLSAIIDIDFSADDNIYAICGDGNLSGGTSGIKVVVYDSKTNKSLLSMAGDDQQRGVHALAISPDGRFLATGGYSYGSSSSGIYPDIDVKLWPIEKYTRQSQVMPRQPDDNPIKSQTIPKLWAVIVGISDYSDPSIDDLKYAHLDATSYRNFLKSVPGGGVGDDQMVLLTDGQATRKNIFKALTNTFARASPNDVIIFYFAGHGQPGYDGNEIFFTTYDTERASFEGDALSQTELEKIFNRSNANKKICIIDACHSGGISNSGIRSTNAGTTNRLVESIAKTKGTIVLSASSRSETSGEDPRLRHGIFTNYLLSGLEGEADLRTYKGNADGIVTIRELYDYVYDQVTKQSKEKQHPQLTGTADNTFPLSVLHKK